MSKRFVVILTVALIALPLALVSCKGKTEKMPEEMKTEASDMSQDVTTTQTQEAQVMQATEPAQTVATETIPPTAAPQVTENIQAAAAQAVTAVHDRSKDIQAALKNAGFYAGAVDGKIGPKTKKAIEAFQKAKGLKVDGKVGPKTWAELEKYLKQQ
jgi:peptidoglycan hydrolase-like protein with peptidoglycan-binding domain